MKAKDDHGFFDLVYQVVRLIPPGRVTSYGAIARYIGSPQSARMVGWALNASGGIPDWVPAHRVVNRKGLLTGKRYFGFDDTMEKMLISEGIEIEDDQILNLEKHFWDPTKELEFGDSEG